MDASFNILQKTHSYRLGSYNRKRESRRVVAKGQGREKPTKTEQRKFRGPEWGPPVGQTALSASPVYTGQAQGEEKTHKNRSQRAGALSFSLLFSLSLFSSCLLGQHALTPQGCIFLYFLNKTEVSESYNTDCPRAVMRRGLYRPSLQIFVLTRQNRGDYTPLTYIYFLNMERWQIIYLPQGPNISHLLSGKSSASTVDTDSHLHLRLYTAAP